MHSIFCSGRPFHPRFFPLPLLLLALSAIAPVAAPAGEPEAGHHGTVVSANARSARATPLPPDSTEKWNRAPGRFSRARTERYTLWLFPCNDSRFTPHMQRIMDEYVLDRVTPGSEILITGHTDMLGEERDNLELSRRRAEGAAAYMRRALAEKRYAALEYEGVGENEPIYPNRLPEMRFYNRTIQVLLHR